MGPRRRDDAARPRPGLLVFVVLAAVGCLRDGASPAAASAEARSTAATTNVRLNPIRIPNVRLRPPVAAAPKTSGTTGRVHGARIVSTPATKAKPRTINTSTVASTDPYQPRHEAYWRGAAAMGWVISVSHRTTVW